MSGTRFARSGRARFFLCFLALVLMLGMVAIFHNTTRQLDQTREYQLLCEQQQVTLNDQLQAIIEQKYTMQKSYDAERNEQMQARLDLEQKVKKNAEQLSKEKLESHVQYDKLQQTFKLIQNEHNQLVGECSKTKQQHLEDINALNLKLEDVLSTTQKEKSVLNGQITALQEKYKALMQEKQHLEINGNTVESRSRILQLEHIVEEYQTVCNYQPKAVSSLAHLQINKPLDIPQIGAANSSPQTAEQKLSFSQQVRVGDGRYNVNINNTNPTNKTELIANNDSLNIISTTGVGLDAAVVVPLTTTTIALPFAERQNRSLILNSVENFQILPKMLKKLALETQTIDKIVAPLGAPHKSTSTESSNKLFKNHNKKQQIELASNTSQAAQSPLSSTSSLPPLPLPPQQQQHQMRKLPENVAPIPENFEEIFKNADQFQHAEKKLIEEDNNNNKNDKKQLVETQGDANLADKQEKIDANNNRYANVVHENSAYMNAKDFNVPANNEDDNRNFFDAAESKNSVNAAAINGNNANNDDDFIGNRDNEPAADAGDIAVKHNKNKLLDVDNVNKEVAGDQGKEFDEGLRLEEGIEEDADEDDEYPNLAARQNGEQAIRN